MHSIPTYHALYFDDVAAAVEFCDRLVSFVVPRVSGGEAGYQHGTPHPAVWFHVPPRSTRTTRDGCYLFLSAGAVMAAERAGMSPAGETSGELPRTALPPGSVLVLGDDLADVPAARPARHTAADRAVGGAYTPSSGVAAPGR